MFHQPLYITTIYLTDPCPQRSSSQNGKLYIKYESIHNNTLSAGEQPSFDSLPTSGATFVHLSPDFLGQ
jgi:hypothetical protein